MSTISSSSAQSTGHIVWVVVALESEFQVPGPWKLIVTGIGKVNAAAVLARELLAAARANTWPDYIINLGTAGSSVLPLGSVVVCTRFEQHDYNLGPLSHLFPPAPEVEVPHASLFTDGHTCHTGDQFVTYANDYPVVEMEAYALARLTQEVEVPFLAIKYISDGTDDDSPEHWQEALPKAQMLLHKALIHALAVLGLM